jgi:hypothetical protein
MPASEPKSTSLLPRLRRDDEASGAGTAAAMAREQAMQERGQM